MWPFTSKKISAPAYSVADQLDLRVKSFTLPEMTPRWTLFAQENRDWNTTTAIKEGYNASAIVYAAVEKRAKLIATAPWKAERWQGDGWVHVPNSPLQQLIDSPNPDTSWYELIYAASQALDLSGNAFISEVKGGSRGKPFQLWNLPSQYIKIKPGRERLVEYYEYEESAGKYKIPEADMVHLRMPNPNSRWFGMPVLMAAGRATDVDRESGAWQKASLQNRGVVDLHIEVPDTVSAEQRAEIRDKIMERQTGPNNARAPIVSSGKVNNLGMTAVEMDFVNSRKETWKEIAMVFGTPLAALGLIDDVNRANGEAMERMVWQDTIIPQLELIKRQLTHQLAKDFGAEWRLEPDLSSVEALQANLEEQTRIAQRLMAMGFTRNEVNARLEMGFDDDPSGDVRYEPSGMMPVGFAEGNADEERAALLKLAYGP